MKEIEEKYSFDFERKNFRRNIEKRDSKKCKNKTSSSHVKLLLQQDSFHDSMKQLQRKKDK